MPNKFCGDDAKARHESIGLSPQIPPKQGSKGEEK
jgi:hypothetical protein